jgi:hypothetical protein
MQTIYIDEQVALTPTDLNVVGSPEEIRHLLQQKLRDRHEGLCNATGYIQRGSLILLTKSMGIFEHGRYTGNVLYHCRASCKIYIPVANTVLHVKITMLNKAGAYGVLATEGEEQAMQIQIPRDLHIGDLRFDAIEIGQVISVELLISRFQTKDPYIQAVAKLYTEEATE